jgi:transcriptional/translational regulatory protein YebC/TACO1
VPTDKLGQVLRLIEALEDHDDVQSVSTNLDIPEGFTLDE